MTINIRRDQATTIGYMVFKNGQKVSFCLVEFAAMFIWAEEIIKEEWHQPMNEEYLEKALWEIFNERVIK